MFEDILESFGDTNWTGFAILYGMVFVVLWLMDFANFFSVIEKIIISIIMLPIVLVILNIRKGK